MKIFVFLVGIYTFLVANSLQDAIDKAQPYSTIHLSKGKYTGHIIINKPIIIIGENNKTIITGNDKATVIIIKSSNVTLKNLTIIGSGNTRENFDGAITANEANNLKIEHCTIKDCLYGIYLGMTNNCFIENNQIRSKNEKIPQRGDGLKLWYSNHNIIKNNIFQKVRDVSLARSNFNIIENNRFFNSRFATYLEFGKNNIIKNNLYKYNEVSVLLMGSELPHPKERSFL
jgi:nitrous oxidase accessory protein